MDVIKARFEGTDVPKEIAAAYRRVFDDSVESGLVLDDLMKHCLFGKYADDPTLHQCILERGTVIWRIMLMLNGNPVLEEPVNENEPEGDIDE